MLAVPNCVSMVFATPPARSASPLARSYTTVPARVMRTTPESCVVLSSSPRDDTSSTTPRPSLLARHDLARFGGRRIRGALRHQLHVETLEPARERERSVVAAAHLRA